MLTAMKPFKFIRARIFSFVLASIRRDLEGKIGERFDRQLSGRLDAVVILQEFLGARSPDPCGSALTTSGAPSLSGKKESPQAEDVYR